VTIQPIRQAITQRTHSSADTSSDRRFGASIGCHDALADQLQNIQF